MLLNIYLGTSAISCAITLLFCDACEKRLKGEGYKCVREKESISEKVLDLLAIVFNCSIPIYNIMLIIKILCKGDIFYESIKDGLLEKGSIYKPISEELNNDCENQNSNKENEDTYTASVQRTKTEKTYDEMTTEEKLDYLQQVREKLINQETQQVESIRP